MPFSVSVISGSRFAALRYTRTSGNPLPVRLLQFDFRTGGLYLPRCCSWNFERGGRPPSAAAVRWQRGGGYTPPAAAVGLMLRGGLPPVVFPLMSMNREYNHSRRTAHGELSRNTNCSNICARHQTWPHTYSIYTHVYGCT